MALVGGSPPALRNVVPHQPVLVPGYRPSACGCMRSNMWGVDLAVGRGCGVRHPGDGAEEISVAIPRVCRPLRRRTSWVATRGRTDVASLAGSAHRGRFGRFLGVRRRNNAPARDSGGEGSRRVGVRIATANILPWVTTQRSCRSVCGSVLLGPRCGSFAEEYEPSTSGRRVGPASEVVTCEPSPFHVKHCELLRARRVEGATRSRRA